MYSHFYLYPLLSFLSFSTSFLPPLSTPTLLPKTHWCWVSLVRSRLGAVDEVDTKITYYRIWRSFKLRPFSIAIAIFIVAHFTAPLKSLKYFYTFSTYMRMYITI